MNNNDFSIHFNNDFDNEGLKTWYISEKHGFCFGMAYVYAKQKNKIILSDLSVDEDQRNKGYGTALQELREQIGIDNNCKWSCLWVKREAGKENGMPDVGINMKVNMKTIKSMFG